MTIGGMFRYDSLRQTFDADPLAAQFGNSAWSHRDVYTVAGLFRYRVGDSYLGAGVAGNWGRGDWTDSVTAATGNFSTNGLMTGVSVGHVFTLYDALVVSRPTRHASKGLGAPMRAEGYVVKLDVSGNVGYWRDRVGSFVDSTGFAWGDEQVRSGRAGGQAMLLASYYRGNYVMTPFVAATVSSQFSFSHTLDIPQQTNQIADTIFYGSPQTFWGARVGYDVTDPWGWNYGVEGFSQTSSQFQVLGGRAYIRTPLNRLLGLTEPSPPILPGTRPR